MVLCFYAISRRGVNHQFFSFFIFHDLMALIGKICGSTADIVLIRMHPAAAPSGHLYFGDRIKILRFPFSLPDIRPSCRIKLFQFHHSVIPDLKNYF